MTLAAPEYRALTLAGWVHYGQRDKGGEPYINHPYRVVRILKALTGGNATEEMVAAAYLHDVIEDSDLTIGALRSMNFDERVVELVDILTRYPHQTRGEYVLRIAGDMDAVLIKTADVLDNMNHQRLAALDVDTRNRLISKYTATLLDLGYFAAEIDDMLIVLAGWPEPDVTDE